jgi:Holliday junction resolvase
VPKTTLSKLSTKELTKLWADFSKSSFDLGTYCRNKDLSQASFRKVLRAAFPDEWDAVLESKKPKQSSYKRGRSLEYAAKKLLKDHDYYVVRAAQSKGLVDLVALRRDHVLLTQGKISGNISNAEAFELIDLADKFGMVPILFARPTGRGVRWYVLKRQDGKLIKEPYTLSHPREFHHMQLPRVLSVEFVEPREYLLPDGKIHQLSTD